MALRILVCPQEFKGSLTAPEAARAIAEGVRRAAPAAAVVEAPMADGGPGTVALVHAAAGGELVAAAEGEPGQGSWRGPLGDPVDAIDAAYALLPDGTAIIEAAATAGLVLVPEAERDPARASTHGVGEQIRDALRRGARRIVVGVGSTGTNDGGAGAAQALGYRLLDVAGESLAPGGLELGRLARIDASDAEPLLDGVELRVAVDVTNRLLGPEGATAVYGPQKGVTPELASRLEAALTRWAERCRADLGVEIADVDGGGGAADCQPAWSRRRARRSRAARPSSPPRSACPTRSPPPTSSSPAKAASTPRPPTAKPSPTSPPSPATPVCPASPSAAPSTPPRTASPTPKPPPPASPSTKRSAEQRSLSPPRRSGWWGGTSTLPQPARRLARAPDNRSRRARWLT